MSSRSNDERGQGLVELALIVPVLLLLLIGILDLGRAVMLTNELDNAAREGTRYAIVHGKNGGNASAGEIQTAVLRYTTGATTTPTVNVSWPDPEGNARGHPVTVDVNTSFTPMLSAFFLGGALRATLGSSSTLTIQQ
ncbi:MAG TPA: TadE/TadG family type IV pilus assembly protein [Jatrophihabitantaceae bacterium]|nr:TadE/TadG family type IV pilus assembly protein [Jatrophihabitantaceae bacterium]